MGTIILHKKGSGNKPGTVQFPKFTDLSIYSPEGLLRVENEFNNRPRITLIDKTPAKLFEPLLAFRNHPLLQ